MTKNAILTSAACAAKPGGKVFYKTFDLTARKVPRATIVSLQKHRKAKRIKLKNKKGIGRQICRQLLEIVTNRVKSPTSVTNFRFVP